jgi:hypothetical protein
MTSAQKMNESSTQKSQEPGELDQPLWAVVSFEQIEATGLTYAEAEQKMRELDGEDVAGLCIITNDAASRITT